MVLVNGLGTSSYIKSPWSNVSLFFQDDSREYTFELNPQLSWFGWLFAIIFILFFIFNTIWFIYIVVKTKFETIGNNLIFYFGTVFGVVLLAIGMYYTFLGPYDFVF